MVPTGKKAKRLSSVNHDNNNNNNNNNNKAIYQSKVPYAFLLNAFSSLIDFSVMNIATFE